MFKRIRKIALWGIIALVVLLVVVLSLLPTAIKHIAQTQYPQYVEQGELSIQDIDLNLFTGTLALKKVQINHNQQPKLSLNTLTLDTRLWSLIKGHVEIQGVELKGFDIAVERGTNSATIAGVTVPLNTGGEAQNIETTQSSFIQSYSLNALRIHDGIVRYKDAVLDTQMTLQKFSVSGLDSRNGEKPVQSHLSLLVNRLALQQAGHTLTLQSDAQLTLSASAKHIMEQPDVTAELALKGIQLNDEPRALSLLALSALNVKAIHFKNHQLSVKAIDLNELALLKKKKNDAVLSVQALQLNDMRVKDFHRVTLNTVNFEGLKSQVVVTKDKQLAMLKTLSAYQPKTQSKPSSSQTTSSVSVAIKQIKLSGQSSVELVDYSLPQRFASHVYIKSLQVDDIDTAKLKQATKVTLNAALSKHNHLNFNGQFNLFAPKLSGNGLLTVKQMELLPFSPYVVGAVGYKIRTGSANANMRFSIKQDKLNGQLKLKLFALSLKAADKRKIKNMQNQTAMPLDLALDLLRNKNDDMDIEIDLKGRVNSPEVGVNQVIVQVTKKVLKKATVIGLQQMLFPYGTLISVGSWVGDKVTAVRLDPLQYPIGALDLDKQQYDYLGKIAEIMTKQTSMRIKLCPVMSVQEFTAIQSPKARSNSLSAWLSAQLPKGSEANKQTINESLFLKIGTHRADNIKRVLIEQKGIASERLLSCETVLSDDEDLTQSILNLEI